MRFALGPKRVDVSMSEDLMSLAPLLEEMTRSKETSLLERERTETKGAFSMPAE